MIRAVIAVAAVYAIAFIAWLMSRWKPVSAKEKELQDEQIEGHVIDVEERLAEQRRRNEERRRKLGLT